MATGYQITYGCYCLGVTHLPGCELSVKPSQAEYAKQKMIMDMVEEAAHRQIRKAALGITENAVVDGHVAPSVKGYAQYDHTHRALAVPAGVKPGQVLVHNGEKAEWKDPPGTEPLDFVYRERKPAPPPPRLTLAEVERIARKEAADFNPEILVVVDSVKVRSGERGFALWFEVGSAREELFVPDKAHAGAVRDVVGDSLNSLAETFLREWKPVRK